jgi:hypothetical protein
MPNKDERGAALRTSSDLPFEQRVDTEPPVDTEAMLKDSIKGLRDTPLPLKIAASIPDTSTFDTAAAQIANMQPKMSNAVLSTAQGADPIAPQSATVPPTPAPQATLETAPMTPDTTVNTPPGAVAGTAPREMKLETGKMSLEGHSVSAALAGAGGVTVNADVLHGDRRAITTITQNLATNTFEIRDAVRALVQATQAQIKQLEEKRLNDPRRRN